MILKQVIRYVNDPTTLEATWVRYDQLPETHVAATPALYDGEGNEVAPAVDAHTVPGDIVETVLRCHAYGNSQMAELRADLGADAAEYETLIAEVEATYVPPPPPPVPTQFELDQARYTKRASAKDSLLAYMAADNMSRVRSGEWTVQQLTSLISDPAVAAANAYMSTLSYELAAQAIQAATTPLLTPQVKALWIGKLQEHFYISG